MGKLDLSNSLRKVAYFARDKVIFDITQNVYSTDGCKVFALASSAKTDTNDSGKSIIKYIDVTVDTKGEALEYTPDNTLVYVVGEDLKYYLDSLVVDGDKIEGTGNATKFSKMHDIYGNDAPNGITLKDYYKEQYEEALRNIIVSKYDSNLGIDGSFGKLLQNEYKSSGETETKYSGCSESKLAKLGVPAWFIKKVDDIERDDSSTNEGIELTTDTYKKYLKTAIQDKINNAAKTEANKYKDKGDYIVEPCTVGE